MKIFNSKKYVWMIVLVFISSLLLAGCSPMVGAGQPLGTQAPLLLNQTYSLGQTFTARQDGLMGVHIWCTLSEPGDGLLIVELRADANTQEVLGRGELNLTGSCVGDWQPVFFNIPGSLTLPVGDYYLDISISGSGSVELANADGAAYMNGSAYLNNYPLPNAQLAFELLYRPGAAILGLAKEASHWLVWSLLAVFMFILPGWAIFDAFWPSWRRIAWIQRACLSLAVGMVVYPILLVLAWVVGVRLGAGLVWIPLGVSCLYLALALFHRLKNGEKFKIRLRSLDGHDIAFGLLSLLILGVRAYIIRLAPLPLWGDAYHHTLISQLIVDNGGLFTDWAPYAELGTMNYHFGFHSLVAAFHWLTGLSMPMAVLVLGQIINAMAVWALYPLACRLGHGKWAGTAVLIIAGLLLTIPLFYVNWSTYTLQTGHLILTVFLWVLYDVLENRQPGLSGAVILGLLLCGLALTHYRVMVYAAVFIALAAATAWKMQNRRSIWAFLVVGGGLALLLFLPWLIRIFPGRTIVGLLSMLKKPASASTSGFAVVYNSFGDLRTYMQPVYWLLFMLSGGVGLWKKQRFIGILLLGCLMILLLANPNWLNLPGSGALKNFSVLLAVYIPAAGMIAAGFGWLMNTRWVQNKQIVKIFIALLLAGCTLIGIRQSLKTLQPEIYSISARPDIKASAWIREYLQDDGGILVNSFLNYGGTVVSGGDGGWWLPYLTGHPTTQPPNVYGSEESSSPEGLYWTNDLVTLILKEGVDSPAVLAELKHRNIEYVYIGQRQGLAGNFSEPSLLNFDILEASPNFEKIYHQDRVWIFKVKN